MDPSTSSSSFEMSYLMNSCGLSENKALTACKRLNFKTSTKPDAVLAVFQDYGFTKSDISRIISQVPLIILSDTDKIIKPKLDYFNSKDISRPEFIRLFTNHPRVLYRSLENHIIPYYNFIKNIVGTDRNVFIVFERASNCAEIVGRFEPNIQVLRDEGVPQSNIVKFIISKPRTLLTTTDRFKDTVQKIKGMGFDNPYQYAFLTGIQALLAMKKSIWETKIDAYKKWGLSEEQILIAFKAHPICMTISVKKIMDTMDYFVNQAGYSPSVVVKTPATLFFSLEKRIIPRVSVYQCLVSKGLIYKNKTSVYSILTMYEKPFLDKFVIKYQKDAPELMEIYNQALNGCVMEEGMQGSTMKKEEEDKYIEEDEIDHVPGVEEDEVDHVPGVEKVVEDSQEVASNKVEETKKANKPKKILKESQVQDTAAIKCVVEVPGLFQASNRPVTKDLQNKEVTFCPPSATEGIAALPKEANAVDKSEVGEPNKKASSSDLVEHEKKSQEAKKLKKAKSPKKIFIEPEKNVEEEEGSLAQEEQEEKSKEEEDTVALPIVEKILEESDASMLRRKLVLATAEEPKKAISPKKLLKKSKKKVEEAQCSDAKKEEHDKSKEEDEVAAGSMAQKVLENNQASVLKSKVALNEAEESGKAKKIRKVLKKLKKKAEEVQGSVAIKYDTEVSELLQASKKPVMGDSQDEDVTFCPESVTESIAALPEVANVVDQSEVSEPKNNASSSEEESMKAKTPKKILIKSKKIEEIMQDSYAKKEEHDKSKKEDEVVAVSMLEKVLDNSQASMLKSKVSLDEVEESKKAVKKVLKKPNKKKAKEIQGTAVIKYDVEVPELLQASNRPVMEDSQDEEVTFCPERVTASIAALPKVANVVDQSEVGEPKKKASSSDLVEQEKRLEDEEESKKTKTPKKIMIKSKKNVEVVQDSAAKKEDDKKSKVEEYVVAVPIIEEILEDSQASLPKRKLVFDTVEEPKKAKRPKKVLKKSKKKVVEEQCSGAKKEEHDMSKEEDEVAAVSVVGEVLEISDASVLKSKVSLDEVEESKKGKKIKKVLKKPKQKAEEMQGSAAFKYDVQVPELLQVSSRPVMEESQNEEVTYCPESMTESIAALPKVANVVDLSEVGELKKTASLNDQVEQDKELEEQELKKPKTPKKILIKSKKNVEVVQGSDAKNEQEEKSKVEEDIVALPIKRKLVFDTGEEPKKAKRPKKLLKRSKKKVVEEQCSGARKEEHDLSKEEDEVAAVSVVEEVLENSVAGVLESKVSLDEGEESKKAKKIKKVLKKPRKKAEEMQGSAAIKYDVEVPELLQVSYRPITEDSQNEEVAFCSESVTESIAALPEVANVVDQSEPKKKASSIDLVEQAKKLEDKEESKKTKTPKKILIKSKRNVQVVQNTAANKEEHDKSKEEDVVASVSIVEEVLENSQASMLKSEVSLDELEELKKAKKIKKVLKKPKKKKATEIQGTAGVKYAVDVPELLQASKSPVIAALPKVVNVVERNEVGEPKKKALSSDLSDLQKKLEEEESKEPKTPKKILIKSKKNVEVVQGSAAKNEEVGKSKEEEDSVAVPIIEKILEHSQASMLKRKLVLDTVDEIKKAKKPKKLLKKSKKKVEEDDEVVAVSKVEKVSENSQASMLKSKVSLDEVERSKKISLKRPKKKAKEMQGSATIKYDVEVPKLLQVSNRPVVEDSQNEEVTICHESVTKNTAALSEVANVVNQSEVSAPKEKALSGDLVEQEKKLLEEESKKAKTPKKLLEKSKKNVEVVQDSAAKKEEHDKFKEEDEVAAVSIVEKVLENSQASMLKRKVSLDEVEESKKAKKIKKVLIKPKKKKAKEMLGTAVIKYDVEVPELFQASVIPVTEDPQNEAENFDPETDTGSVAALPKVAKVFNNCEVGGLEKKASSRDLVHQNEKLEQEEQELKKANKPKKILKKLKKKVEVVQGCDAQEEEEDKPVAGKLFLDAEEPRKAKGLRRF